MTQETKKRLEITQMNRTIRQMQNELTRLRRDENFIQQIKTQEFLLRNKEEFLTKSKG
jgi:hypothetical protein